MVGRLHEKVALVVGAGSIGPGWGNGKAAAVLFARKGAKVAERRAEAPLRDLSAPFGSLRVSRSSFVFTAPRA